MNKIIPILFNLFCLHFVIFTLARPVPLYTVRKTQIPSISSTASTIPFNSSVIIKVQGGDDPDPAVQTKRAFIKQMMKDAWDDYVKYAWGQNELKPVSQRGHDGAGFEGSRLGLTIIDSLDTLYIMGLDKEYKKARDWVVNELTYDKSHSSVSIFEVNIRLLGGFLSAYKLTNDTVFKDRAYEIGKRLLPAFESQSGLPYRRINLKTGYPERGHTAILAEIGTLELEFNYLSEVTGNPIFRNKMQSIRRVLKNSNRYKGLYGDLLNIQSGVIEGDHVSIGANSDSFYEYLLKSYIQTGDTQAKELYQNAITAFFANGLVRKSSPSNFTYIAESRFGEVRNEVGHLACFAGGMLVLGSQADPNHKYAARNFELGNNFTDTCHESYIRTKSRLGPETFVFSEYEEAEYNMNPNYILRPETIESYFILYRITKDAKYREWAWDAAQAIQKYCKVEPGRGYSGIKNVDVDLRHRTFDDVQQSFFLAETLKYLYLIFSSDDLIDLKYWVFNTEAHPLPIKGTNPWF